MKQIYLSLIAIVLTCLGLNAQNAENIFITGDAIETGWTSSNPEETRLVQQADGTYQWKGMMQKEGRFRFLTTNKWYPTYTTTESSHKRVYEGSYPIQYDTNGRPNEPSFKVGTGGEYTVTLDLEAMTMTLKLDKKVENPEDTHIYIVGDGCPVGWSLGSAIELDRLSDNQFTWTGDLTKANDGRFRFITSRNWWPSYTTANPEHTYVKAGVYALAYYEEGPKGEPSFKVEVPGNYTVLLDIEAMTMTLTLNTAYEEKQMFIMGTAITGEDLAEGDAYPTADMHLTGTGIFEWTGDLYSTTGSNTTALFKFSPDLEEDVTRTCRTDMAGDEPVADGDTFDLFEKTAGEGNDNWFTINKSGSYTVVVDTRVMTMSVARNKSELYIVGGSVTGSNTPWGFNDKYLSKMTETDTPLVFEWTGYLHATSENGQEAQFKFLKSNSAWAGFVNGAGEHTTVEIGGSYPLLDSTVPGSGDFKFAVPADGMYRLVADIRNLTLSVADGDSGILAASGDNDVEICLSGRTLTVKACEPTAVTVYALSGRTVAAATLAEGSLTLPSAGIYVVKANDTASKIAVK